LAYNEEGAQKIKLAGERREELRTWPKSVTENAGAELLSVQEGREPSSWKPMPVSAPALTRSELAMMAKHTG